MTTHPESQGEDMVGWQSWSIASVLKTEGH